TSAPTSPQTTHSRRVEAKRQPTEAIPRSVCRHARGKPRLCSLQGERARCPAGRLVLSHVRMQSLEAKRVERGREFMAKNTVAAPMGDRLLTLREAAEVLRLSTRTVREYVRRGEVDGRIIGGRWRFRRADLDAFFENAPRRWDFDGKRFDGD